MDGAAVHDPPNVQSPPPPCLAHDLPLRARLEHGGVRVQPHRRWARVHLVRGIRDGVGEAVGWSDGHKRLLLLAHLPTYLLRGCRVAELMWQVVRARRIVGRGGALAALGGKRLAR